MVFAKRILKRDHVAAGIREARLFNILRVAESHGHDFGQPVAGKECAKLADRLLLRREDVVRLANPRKRRLHPFIAVDPRDFLDQIRFLGYIVPP